MGPASLFAGLGPEWVCDALRFPTKNYEQPQAKSPWRIKSSALDSVCTALSLNGTLRSVAGFRLQDPLRSGRARMSAR
jgi:hypothetical protein